MQTLRSATIIVKGNPVSVNAAWRRGLSFTGRPTTYLDPAARSWKEQVAWAAKLKWKGTPLRSPVRVTITAHFKDNRRRDIANVEKLAVDALQGICMVDDSQVEEEHLYKKTDPKDPRLVILIEEISV